MSPALPWHAARRTVVAEAVASRTSVRREAGQRF